MRILVVDDDERLSRAVARALGMDGHAVDTATSAAEARAQVAASRYDLFVLDVRMPGEDGISLCRHISAAQEGAILMLTAADAVEDRVRGLDAGADDYVVKPFAMEELLARARALGRRTGQGDTELVFSDLRLDERLCDVNRAGHGISLSPKEFELLRFFMRHPRQVLRDEQILEQVWGYDFGGDPNVIEVYVGYLRRKLGPPRLIQTVRGFGYALRESRGNDS